MLRPTDDKIQLTAERLVEALKAHGAEHAQKVFAALVADYRLKDWEVRAVRERFQQLTA
jgi:hypothetical protein